MAGHVFYMPCPVTGMYPPQQKRHQYPRKGGESGRPRPEEDRIQFILMISRTPQFLLFLPLLLWVSLPILAQDSPPVELKLIGNTTPPYSGFILDANEKRVEIRLVRGGKLTLETSRLDPTSLQHVYQYLLKNWDLEKPDQRLRLGDFCKSMNLFSFAETHYRAVLSLDSDQTEQISQKLKVLEQAHLQHLLQTALDALSAGRQKEAVRYLRRISRKAPASEEGQAAQKILAGIELRPPEGEEKPAAPDPVSPSPSRWTRAMKELVLPPVQKAHTLHRRGLNFEGNRQASRGVECYKQAVDSLDLAEKRAKLVEKHCRQKTDLPGPKERQSYQDLQTDIRQLRIQLYLALANHHAAARRLERAREFTNLALSVDPDEPSALTLRDRITDEILRRGVR